MAFSAAQEELLVGYVTSQAPACMLQGVCLRHQLLEQAELLQHQPQIQLGAAMGAADTYSSGSSTTAGLLSRPAGAAE